MVLIAWLHTIRACLFATDTAASGFMSYVPMQSS